MRAHNCVLRVESVSGNVGSSIVPGPLAVTTLGTPSCDIGPDDWASFDLGYCLESDIRNRKRAIGMPMPFHVSTWGRSQAAGLANRIRLSVRFTCDEAPQARTRRYDFVQDAPAGCVGR